MTRPIAPFICLILTAMQAAPADDPPTSTKNLQGAWTCTSAVIDGRPLGEETVKTLKLTLTADRYKTERGDQVLFDSTYTIDASKDPKQIDMIGTEGDLKGKPAFGIYKLEGDTLTLCYVMPGQPRPAKFESTPQSGIFLIVWKRQ
jgi:uncharacterized protein (TIGR03067 family)